MSNNDKPLPVKDQEPTFDNVKGGYNPPRFEQRPPPPAEPPKKQKND